MSFQMDIFGGETQLQQRPAPPRPRPVQIRAERPAEYVETADGWTVVVFTLIPKMGWGHLEFPHYWGGPPEQPVWRCARHGEVPPGTFLFTSREHAREVVAQAFGHDRDVYQHMGRIEIPSDDNRRRRR
ncbi:hypothetical protein [Actinoplanes sp. URMC 104]|uniref:hypothetical protein n=1 Tax=Actinoplanes sp. URMC 104 TaxID=3423409 RepID=UPI003F1E1F93